ncbi:MAG: hypothetical protein ACJAVK_003532 [Akkermansiaceae bacterium]|jgi:hypothetical protein
MAEVLEDYHDRVGDERELLVLYAEKGGEMRSLVWVRRGSGLAIGGVFFLITNPSAGSYLMLNINWMIQRPRSPKTVDSSLVVGLAAELVI